MANGGKRPGAGRKPGSKSAKTLEREKVLAALSQRIMRNVDIIYDSQLSLAQGTQYLFRIDKTYVSTGKNRGYWKKEKAELVTSQEEIRAYLERTVVEGDADDDQDPGASYYYITTEKPENQAIDSMLNRALGKAVNHVDLTSDGKEIQGNTIIFKNFDGSKAGSK